MHRILERQIKHSLGTLSSANASPQLLALLQMISDTYEHSDEDRQLLSRSLDLSSKEFVEMNKKLHSENEIIEQKVKDRTLELEYEKAKLGTMAEYMTTGTILLDRKGEPTFLNRAASELLGSPPLEKAIDVLSKCFTVVPIRMHIEESLKGSSLTIPEAEISGRIFSISFVSLKNKTETFGTLIWLNDITNQILLDRAKDQFIAIASHEMRTPLAVIRGNAELMLDDERVKKDPELTEETQHILKSSIRLLGIVNDFLNLQNLENQKIALNPERIDLIQILKETIADLSGLAAQKNIALKFDAESAPVVLFIKIDRARLQQIFTNLISNAINYTDKGYISVYIEKTENIVKILFKDTGMGIDLEDQGRLFKKFATAKIFLRTKEYGSGLGLYISNLLATAMNCKIKLEKSEVGVGSIFSLTIPLTPFGEADDL